MNFPLMHPQKYIPLFLKKSLCALLIFALTSVPVLNESSIAYAMDSLDYDSRENLVLVLVEDGLMSDQESYPILQSNSANLLSTSKLSTRVKRYSRDISKKFSNTDVSIIKIPKSQDPIATATTLKNIYFNNIQEFENQELKGIVLIGDIGLPVLHSQDEKIISLYPFTDFVEPAYDFNPISNNFEVNLNAPNPEPEIWHGVINFTQDSSKRERRQKIAEFLDKNHLNAQNVPDYINNTSANILLADSVKESQLFLEEIKPIYDVFQNANKYLAQNKVSKEVIQALNADNALPSFQSILENIDDMSDTMMPTLLKGMKVGAATLFKNAVKENAEKAAQTGRYDYGSTYSPFLLIEYLDGFAAGYLQKVNQLVQAKFLAAYQEIAQPVNILKGASITITTTDREDDSNRIIDGQLFLNHGTTDSFFEGLNDLDEPLEILASHTPVIHGRDLNSINDSFDCRLFRGGGLQEDVHKTMYNNRGALLDVNPNDQGLTCYKTPRETNQQKLHRSSYDKDLDSNSCTLFKGDNLQDEYRGHPVELDFPSRLGVQSCFAMNSFNAFLDKKGSGAIFGFPINAGNTGLLNREEDSDINIGIIDGRLVSLSDIFQLIQPDLDPQDWHRYSSYFLANPVKDSFEVQDPFGPQSTIASLRLDVQQHATDKDISSLTLHADPDPAMVYKSLVSGNLNLPFDHRNYVSYYDFSGEFHTDLLPDPFYASSYADFSSTIQEYINKFSTLNLNNQTASQLASIFNQSYQDSISIDSNIQDIPPNGVSALKFEFLLNYLSLDLNNKYRLILQSLLDDNFSINLDGFAEDFDFVEINSFADPDQLLFDLTTPGFADLQISQPLKGPIQEEYIEGFDGENSGIGILEYFTEYLPEWYQEQGERVKSVFDSDSYSLIWPEDTNMFEVTSVIPSKLEIEGFPKFVDINSQSISFQIKAVTDKGYLSDDFEEFITLPNSPLFSYISQDLDPNLQGYQAKFQDGRLEVTIAPQEAGVIDLLIDLTFAYIPISEQNTIRATLQPLPRTISTRLQSQFVDQLDISADSLTSIQTLSADDLQEQLLSFKLVDREGSIVDFGQPTLISQQKGPSIKFESASNGVYNFKLNLPSKAGQYDFELQFPGSQKLKHSITVLPGQASQLQLNSSQNLFSSLNAHSLDVSVVLYDQYSNIVSTDNQEFELEYDQSKVVLSPNTPNSFNRGKAQLEFETQALQVGYFEITARYQNLEAKDKYNLTLGITNQDLLNQKSKSLSYLLNTDQSEIFNQRSENLLASGKTQAIISRTNPIRYNPALLSIHPDLSIELDANKISSTVEFIPGQIIYNFIFNDQRFLKLSYDTQQRVKVDPSQELASDEFFAIISPSAEAEFDQNHVSLKDQLLIDLTDGILIDSEVEVVTSPNNPFEIIFKFQDIEFARAYINPQKARLNSNPISYKHYDIKKSKQNIHEQYNYHESLVFYTDNQNISSFLKPESNQLSSGMENADRLLNPDDKTLLLFTSGQALGASLKSHADFATVLIGDPTLKLQEQQIQNEQYNNTLGFQLDSLEYPVASILSTQDYIFMADDNGQVSIYNKEQQILQKNHLKLPSKPSQMLVWNTSPLQVLVLLQDHCHVKDTCTYLLQEDPDDNLILERFDFPVPAKPLAIFAEDFNDDQKADIAYFDENYNFRIYNRSNQGLEKKFQSFIFPYSAQYFLDENFIYLAEPNPINPNQEENSLVPLSINSTVESSDISLTATPDPENSDYIDLQFKLNINKANPNQPLTSKLALLAPEFLQLVSLKHQRQTIDFLPQEGGNVNFLSAEPLTIQNSAPILIQARVQASKLTGSPHITTQVDEFLTTTLSQQQIDFTQTANFNTQSDPQDIPRLLPEPRDNQTDIQIPLLGGDTIIHLQSSRFGYTPVKQRITPPRIEIPEVESLPSPEDIANATEEELNQMAEDSRRQTFFTDEDQDNMPDLYSSLARDANYLANKSTNILEDLVCNQGCLAVPINVAFLVPGSRLSPPVPIFGWGCPWVGSIGVGTPAMPCAGKIYISPTLTGQFVLSPCLYGACMMLNIASLPASTCKKANKKIVDAMNYVAGGVESSSGGVINFTNGRAPRPSRIPGFPAFFSDWIENQYLEFLKVFDLPDLTLIYPDINPNSEFQIFSGPSYLSELGAFFDTNDQDLDKIDELNPFPACPEQKAKVSWTDEIKKQCGGFEDFAKYQEAKSSYYERFMNNPQEYFEQLSKMPIWNFNVENFYFQVPYPDQKELGRFTKELLKSIDNTVQNFLRAFLSWGCLEYQEVERDNEFGDFTRSDMGDDFLKIFENLGDQITGGDQSGEFEIVFEYDDVTYQEFSEYISAIFEEFSSAEDAISFMIDLVIGGHLSNIVSVVNQVPKDGTVDPNDPKYETKKACIDMTVGVESLTSNLFESYRAAIAWRDIPLQIFELQDFIAKYTVQVLDWGDQVLGNITKWFGDMTTNLSTWTRMFEDLIKLMSSFNFIFEIFIDFFEKCDDCRTRRNSSGIDILLNLLSSVANALPVLNLPTLPDLTLDISKIKTGLEIQMPLIKFEHQPLRIPVFQFAIDFPSAPDVRIGALFDNISIPVLPGPPDLTNVIDFPDLPKVQIPLLPIIPKAPELGDFTLDLQGELRGTLDFIKKLLKIYCLVLQGLAPVPEITLAGAIEDFTARPLEPILPIDRAISLAIPNLGIDYVKEYIATLELDLVYDVSSIHEALKELNLRYSEKINDIVGVYNQKVQELNESMNFEYQLFEDYQLEDIDLNLNPDDEEGNQALESLNKAYTYIAQVQAIQDNLQPKQPPSELSLQTFVPREDFKIEDSIFSNSKKLQQASRMVDHIYKKTDKDFIASINPIEASAITNLEQTFEFKQNIREQFSQVHNDSLQVLEGLQTLALESNPLLAANDQEASSSVPATIPKGLHFVRPDNSFKKLYTYDQEDLSEHLMDITNVDRDSDDDIVHTISKQVFVKHKNGQRISSVGSSGKDYNLNQLGQSLEQIQEQKLIKSPRLSIDTSHETLNLAFSEIDPTSQTVIDVYKPGYTNLEPYHRYIINHDSDNLEVAKYLQDSKQQEEEGIQSLTETEFIQVSEFATQQGSIKRQDFQKMFIKNSSSKSQSISIPNGMYSVVQGQVIAGKVQTVQRPVPVSLDFCSDRTPPTISGNLREIASPIIFQTPIIDITPSFDIGSRITNLKLIHDSTPHSLDLNNPTFELPQVTSSQLPSLKILAEDLAGNQSELLINPRLQSLSIDLSKVSPTVIKGKVNPSVDQGSVTLIKSNGHRLIPIKEQELDKSEFEFLFDSTNNIEVTDNANNSLLEIDSETNQIQVNDPSLNFTILNSYQDLSLLTLLVEKDQLPVTQVTLKADPNLNLSLLENQSQSLNTPSQVVIYDNDIQDAMQVTIVDDPENPLDQNAVVSHLDQDILVIQRSGNPILLDKAYSLILNDQSNPETSNLQDQWISLRTSKDAPNLVSFKIQNLDNSIVQDQLKAQVAKDKQTLVQDSQEKFVDPTTLKVESQFADVDGSTPGFQEINRLRKLGIVEGVVKDGETYFLPTNFLLRSEYAKILLKIMCIKPRPEAYLAPNVFWDIPFSSNLPWYYPQTKETYLLGIFEGYTGELDANNQAPFKPFNTISRIEAVKVVMEALEELQQISLDKLEVTSPWYADYLKYSQDLSSLATSDQELKSNFLLTKEEALEPNVPVSRADFAIIVSRALDIYNCREIREDLKLPLEDLRLDKTIDPIQESQNRQEEIQATQEILEGQEEDTPPVEDKPLEEQILDILDNIDDSTLDDTSDSSINIQEPSCTFCPCPFEVLDGLGLQKKEKFFIIYGEYHPLDPKVYAKSKFFEFNPK